jgi:hypothetical protein
MQLAGLFLLFCWLIVAHSLVNSVYSSGRPQILHTARILSSQKPQYVQRRFDLPAYGDPDLEMESNFYRWWQDTTRKWDKFVYPNDPDVPGLTFPSPIEWAPWMETVWFGNYYDYRAAFFSDVMYSNNVPGQDGALLFRDRDKALQMALLYQRYKKFDTDSYAVSNATFYNVFAAQAVRMGRYKLPQSNDIILCITDPLTFTQIKRYLNTFNLIKFFKNKFMQQQRKRQYVMDIGSNDSGGGSTSRALPVGGISSASGGGKVGGEGSFFSDAVFRLEYARMMDEDLLSGRAAAGKIHVTIPLLPGR